VTLPSTYYDFILKRRPALVEHGERDAADLLSRANPPEAIRSADDYDSRFPQYVEKLHAEVLGYGADHPGVSVDEFMSRAPSLPQALTATLPSLYSTVNLEYHCVVNFALAGKKVFHFSDNLVEHLANTEINLKAALIQLPFATCLFVFTSPAAIDAMYKLRDNAGRRGPGAPGPDYSAPVSVFITVVSAGPDLPGRKLLICAMHARPPGAAYLGLKRVLYLGDDWTLEKVLRTDWETLTPESAGEGMRLDAGEESMEPQGDETFFTDGLGFFRIVLNAVLGLFHKSLMKPEARHVLRKQCSL
jgi:hypothetical protein